MPAIVFDIETVGVDFESLSDATQENLLKRAETAEEKQVVRDSLGLYPLTGQIVAIGMIEAGTDNGVVFFQDPDGKTESFKENNTDYIVCSEKEILEFFWQKMRRFNQFVTFNGRGFDCPYIMIRSGINKVKPVKELMPYRYDTKIHIDLFDQLGYYGATRRGFSLHMWCEAFGITSPKEEGISGGDVGKLYKEGKCVDIARYCMRDVQATKDLYLNWNEYIRPEYR
ncbi:MAG: 3'-5' exonuclease [PVC group bacterium]|nr:3'-5' exonuclease [PVC group bacterium]